MTLREKETLFFSKSRPRKKVLHFIPPSVEREEKYITKIFPQDFLGKVGGSRKIFRTFWEKRRKSNKTCLPEKEIEKSPSQKKSPEIKHLFCQNCDIFVRLLQMNLVTFFDRHLSSPQLKLVLHHQPNVKFGSLNQWFFLSPNETKPKQPKIWIYQILRGHLKRDFERSFLVECKF